MEDRTPAEWTEFVHEMMPFTQALGLSVLEASPDWVVVAGDWSEGRCTSAGMLHGGYLMALVDSAGGLCAFLNLPQGATGTSTIESKTNFVGSVRAGRVTVTATPVHVGRTTIVVQTDARDERDRLVTRTLQTQAVLRPS